MSDSFVSVATYNVTASPPAVEFHLTADSGSEFLARDYPLVKLSNVSSATVQVSYSVTGGTATNGSDYILSSGTLTFPPGEQYRYFALPVTNDAIDEPDETVVITLSSPVNATLGARTTYTYTILDNDSPPNQPPVVNIDAPGSASVGVPASLSATVSDDGLPGPAGTVTASWSAEAGPGGVTFSDPHAVTPTASFALPGTYVLRLTASDGALVASGEITVAVRDTFAAWSQRHGVSADGSDSDGDGLAGLVEYVLGGDPASAGSAPRPAWKVARNRLTLTFTRDPTLTDATISVWGADTAAGAWTELAASTGGGPFDILFPGATAAESSVGVLQSVEIRDAFNLRDPAHPNRFLQLRVAW